jgi:integrase/recombinase XerC
VSARVAPAEIEQHLGRLATERACSPRTLASYRADLALLCELLVPSAAADGASPDWSRLDEVLLRRWVAGATRQGLSPRSVARRLSCWRGFLDALVLQGRLAANPARALRAPRAPRRLPKALSPDQAGALVSGPADGFGGLRDRALIELLYSSGLRLSELTSLDVQYTERPGYRSSSWLSLSEAEVNVLGKGARRRTVPVGSQALAALKDWLALRADWLAGRPGADRDALFLSIRGTRLANRSVQARLGALGIGQALPTRLHPHVLRHSFASHLLQSSGDLRAVQELMGHASIRSTQVYTALDFQRLAGVYDAAHPRARRQ